MENLEDYTKAICHMGLLGTPSDSVQLRYMAMAEFSGLW